MSQSTPTQDIHKSDRVVYIATRLRGFPGSPMASEVSVAYDSAETAALEPLGKFFKDCRRSIRIPAASYQQARERFTNVDLPILISATNVALAELGESATFHPVDFDELQSSVKSGSVYRPQSTPTATRRQRRPLEGSTSRYGQESKTEVPTVARSSLKPRSRTKPPTDRDIDENGVPQDVKGYHPDPDGNFDEGGSKADPAAGSSTPPIRSDKRRCRPTW